MEVKIQEKFIKKYGEGNLVRLRKYVKKGLSVAEISILFYDVMSYDTIIRWIEKIRAGDK